MSVYRDRHCQVFPLNSRPIEFHLSDCSLAKQPYIGELYTSLITAQTK